MTRLINCRIVDVRKGVVRSESCIEIDGGVIRRLERQGQASRLNVVDMEGLYITPGLITCHTHLSVVYPFSETDEHESPATTALRAVSRAREALQAGVTTVRCVHEQNRIDLYIRSAAVRGWIEAPRILGAGRAISTTGGHGSGIGCVLADGGDAFLHAARAELAAGADHVKVFITGGIADVEEGFDVPQMTEEEMHAVVQAARAHHSYVVAHAGSSAAIQKALSAGILSFEHGYWLDDETVMMMAKAGAFLTPTLCVTSLPQWMQDHRFTPAQIDKAMEVHSVHVDSIRRAIRAGVILVNGTDYVPGAPCDGTSVVVREMELMVEAGLTPLQSLQAATIHAARLCRIDDKVGAVEPGMLADLIAVEGNPLEDISAMRQLRLVMQSGRIVRSDLRGSSV